MRRKSETVLTFAWNNDRLPKSVLAWREKYKGISRVLDDHPEILEAVHEDLKKLSLGGSKGREGDFTSETILRALVVHAIQGGSLRDTVREIAESDFLQEEGGEGPHVPGSVLAGGSARHVEAGPRVARAAGGRAADDRDGHDSHGHHGGGDEHPLADRRVAVVGHVAGGVAASEAGPGNRAGKLPAPLP